MTYATVPALDGQGDQRACKQCCKLFLPRQHTGGSVQSFCSTGCRLAFHKERQRNQRIASYAGQPTVPATLQAGPSETLRSKPAVNQLHPWETGVLDIANWDRTEFVLALKEGEAAGTRPETWPPGVLALIEHHVSRWIEENKQMHTLHAVTAAAPKYAGVQSCVLILHHRQRE